MELESVRALKEEMLATALSPQRQLRSRKVVRARVEELSLTVGRTEAQFPKVEVALSRPAIALGVAAGPRGGYSLAIRVQDRRVIRGPTLEKLRRSARGEVDVRFVGRPVPAAASDWHRSRCEPLRSGTSIGSKVQRTTGTLGCFVEPEGGGPLHILSNSHVLAGWGRGRRGDAILQPGWEDDGEDHPAIATLEDHVDLRHRGADEADCAVARVVDGSSADVTRGLSVASPQLEQAVFKDGRTTGRTSGRVGAIEVGPLEIDYPKPVGRLEFNDLTEVDGVEGQRFGDHGDSGSAVFSGASELAGLLFAVTRRGGRTRLGVAYLTPFDKALARLGMRPVP
jgi:hypothetical protein